MKKETYFEVGRHSYSRTIGQDGTPTLHVAVYVSGYDGRVSAFLKNDGEQIRYEISSAETWAAHEIAFDTSEKSGFQFVFKRLSLVSPGDDYYVEAVLESGGERKVVRGDNFSITAKDLR
jgi:hypothetical protein